MMGVYEIINIADGKMTSYVGSSVHVKRRWREHVGQLRKGTHKNRRLQAAWSRDGEGAFMFCLLEVVAERDGLRDREQIYMDRLFETSDNPYNIGRDAHKPMLGVIPSEETRKRMSVAGYNRPPMSAETRRKIGKWSRSWKGPPEVGQKISKALTGRKQSPEHREKNRRARTGVKQSEETIRKRVESLRGRIMSQENKDKLAEANAKPYPAFVHQETGEVIPGGKNLSKVCRARSLNTTCMWRVAHGIRSYHKGWELLEKKEID